MVFNVFVTCANTLLSGKLLKVLHPNDTVRAKDPRRRGWSERARVVGLSGPRSCDV